MYDLSSYDMQTDLRRKVTSEFSIVSKVFLLDFYQASIILIIHTLTSLKSPSDLHFKPFKTASLRKRPRQVSPNLFERNSLCYYCVQRKKAVNGVISIAAVEVVALNGLVKPIAKSNNFSPPNAISRCRIILGVLIFLSFGQEAAEKTMEEAHYHGSILACV
jgi:hypothetical protein